MSSGKDLNREIIHKLLDGELADEEKQALMDQVQSDPALKEEFDGFTRALRAVKTSRPVPVSPFFTAEVMRRLPRRKAALGRRIWDFLFTGRILHWNVATAIVTAGIAVIVLTQVIRLQHRPVETAIVPQQEQTVTVRMNFYAPEARHVAVAGTFNKWKVDADVLTKQENGTWTIDIPLKPGVYTYMFVVDGKAWVTDPNAESYRDDGFGYQNSVVSVDL